MTKVKFSRTARFDRSLHQLKKRYPHITVDLIPVFEILEASPETGTVIPRDYQIRKMRVSSSDMKRGKSGGFRLLYKALLQDADHPELTLLFIYAKSDQNDVPLVFLRTLLADLSDED